MLKIRLARAGRRNRPFYRIVVADARSKRDGKYRDLIGIFDPIDHAGWKRRRIDCDKYNYWISKGAQPTKRVKQLCAGCGKVNPFIQTLVSFLMGSKRKSNYRTIIDKINRANPDPHYLFEALFVFQSSSLGIEPEYERPFSPGKTKTVDFLTGEEGVECFFELLRLDESAVIRKIGAPDDQGIYQILLSSESANPHLRPAAQDIRLQEKLCEKLEKFSEDDSKLAIIVVDCSKAHLGMLDDDDIRSLMTGAPKLAINTQSLDGKERVKGLLEDDCPTRGSADFREKISAVIFVPSLEANYFESAMIAVNSRRSDEHKRLLLKHLKSNPIFQVMSLIDY